MLHNKDIKNLSELKTTFLCDDKKESFFTKMISILKIGKQHAIFSTVKEKLFYWLLNCFFGCKGP